MLDRSTAKWRRKRFRKCKAYPKEALFCDGCKTTSSKCPMRCKSRDVRCKEKAAYLRRLKDDA